MEVAISAELAKEGVKIEPVKRLYSPPNGYFLKPNGEVGLLPADPTRLDYYTWKGFEFLGLETEIDRDQINDKLKRTRTRQQKKIEKGGKI